MDKLTLAHDYYMQHIKVGKYVSEGEAWNYVDAMLEELEKRKDKTLPDAIVSDFEKEAVNNANIYGTGFIKITKDGNEFKYESIDPKLVTFSISSGSWQPDWSLAPDDAVACAMDSNGDMWWHSKKPEIDGKSWIGFAIDEYENHNYTGDWRNSLRIRPSSK